MEQVLGVFVGIIFAGLGILMLVKNKTLTSHSYFRILIYCVAVILIGFGIYLGINGFFWK